MKICEKRVPSTGSNISHLKIVKERNRDLKYVNKFYTENININLKNFENEENLRLQFSIT